MSSDFTIDDLRAQLLEIKATEVEPADPLASGDPVEFFREDRKTTLARVERIIAAMTAAERAQPEGIGPAERQRIAAASGSRPEEVDYFLTQFAKVRTMMRDLAGMSFWQRAKKVVVG
jgi:signal recognition particle subunit SRP54